MNDQEIIEGLIARDNRVTEEFFFVRCRPLFCRIISTVFCYEVDYDEFVNELYQYLMENDAARLRGFGYRSSVYQWMKVLAIRFFLKKRDALIENASHEPLYEESGHETTADHDRLTARMDLERLFDQMENPRYVQVLRQLLIEEESPERLAKRMGVTPANLYNIKRRAMASLTRAALKDIRNYGKQEKYS